jgi:hypothetical protein
MNEITLIDGPVTLSIGEGSAQEIYEAFTRCCAFASVVISERNQTEATMLSELPVPQHAN